LGHRLHARARRGAGAQAGPRRGRGLRERLPRVGAAGGSAGAASGDLRSSRWQQGGSGGLWTGLSATGGARRGKRRRQREVKALRRRWGWGSAGGLGRKNSRCDHVGWGRRLTRPWQGAARQADPKQGLPSVGGEKRQRTGSEGHRAERGRGWAGGGGGGAAAPFVRAACAAGASCPRVRHDDRNGPALKVAVKPALVTALRRAHMGWCRGRLGHDQGRASKDGGAGGIGWPRFLYRRGSWVTAWVAGAWSSAAVAQAGVQCVRGAARAVLRAWRGQWRQLRRGAGWPSARARCDGPAVQGLVRVWSGAAGAACAGSALGRCAAGRLRRRRCKEQGDREGGTRGSACCGSAQRGAWRRA
jgi:hypothetical protein